METNTQPPRAGLLTVKQIVHHQANNARRLVTGLPVQPPSIGSMTLDRDDVKLADHFLRDRTRWDDISEVQQYESEFAEWNGSRYAFAFMGGRIALSAAIHALGLNEEDEVIVPGYTCVVVPNAFKFAGVKPIYADIELDTFGLCIKSIRERLTPKTKAIMIQHLYGLVCRDYEAILDLARSLGLKVIEDCTHATGAIYKDRRVGNGGDVAFYSSETSKIYSTIQGGIVSTNQKKIARKLSEYQKNAAFPSASRTEKLLHLVKINYYRYKHRHRWILGDYYRLRYYGKELASTTHEEIRGEKPAHYGSRMPAPLAAIGRNQLKKIDRYNELRRQQSQKWNQWCEKNHYNKPSVIPESKPVWLRFPVLVEPEKKRNTSWALKELGVEPGVWFLGHLHPKNGAVRDCPNADTAVAQCINFPTLC